MIESFAYGILNLLFFRGFIAVRQLQNPWDSTKATHLWEIMISACVSARIRKRIFVVGRVGSLLALCWFFVGGHWSLKSFFHSGKKSFLFVSLWGIRQV
jgi:hypothetical protein